MKIEISTHAYASCIAALDYCMDHIVRPESTQHRKMSEALVEMRAALQTATFEAIRGANAGQTELSL